MPHAGLVEVEQVEEEVIHVVLDQWTSELTRLDVVVLEGMLHPPPREARLADHFDLSLCSVSSSAMSASYAAMTVASSPWPKSQQGPLSRTHLQIPILL